MSACEAMYQAWWDDLTPVGRALARELYRNHLLPGPFVTSLANAGVLQLSDPHEPGSEACALGIPVRDDLAEFLDHKREAPV